MHVALAGPASPQSLVDLLGMTNPTDVPVGLGGSPVNALVRALLDAGHRVTLVTLSPDIGCPWEAVSPRFSLACFPWRRRARDRARDGFRAERRGVLAGLRASGAEVVHAHWTYEYACAALSSGLPVLVTVHDAPVTILRHHPDVYRLIRLALAARVRLSNTQLTAVSPYAAQRWSREMHDRRSVPVIPNIAPLVPESSRLSTGERRVVMIGTAARLKNISTGIDAFLLAQAVQPDLRLRVIGPDLGPGSVLAGRYRSSSGVSFVGELPSAQVHRELSAASVLLHPSLEETQGMALLEAMRSKVPVIAGESSGGVPWTLDDGAAGMLVDVTSPQAMQAAVLAMVSDEALAAGYVHRATELLAARFSPPAVAAASTSIYEDLVAGAKG
jgi:glycosyltransferase involved in cell wall biosynthesis